MRILHLILHKIEKNVYTVGILNVVSFIYQDQAIVQKNYYPPAFFPRIPIIQPN